MIRNSELLRPAFNIPTSSPSLLTIGEPDKPSAENSLLRLKGNSLFI